MKTSRKNKMKELFRCNIAGVQYGDYQTAVGLKVGSILKLFPDTKNPYDSHAIKVMYGDARLGYIPKGEYQDMLWQLRADKIKVSCEISSYNRTNPTWNMFVIKISVDAKDAAYIQSDDNYPF
jgi:HIRAN domain